MHLCYVMPLILEEAQNPGPGFKYSEGRDRSMFKMQWVVILAS